MNAQLKSYPLLLFAFTAVNLLDLIHPIKMTVLTISPLSLTKVVFICFISKLNHIYQVRNQCLNIKICKCLVSN